MYMVERRYLFIFWILEGEGDCCDDGLYVFETYKFSTSVEAEQYIYNKAKKVKVIKTIKI